MDLFCYLCSVLCVCNALMSVYCSLAVTCWERANLLAILYVMFTCFFVTFSMCCPGSGVILDCIDS